jgi:hypothetical protein
MRSYLCHAELPLFALARGCRHAIKFSILFLSLYGPLTQCATIRLHYEYYFGLKDAYFVRNYTLALKYLDSM